MIKNREFLKGLAKIAMPIALQNFLTSLLNMIDTMMIGSLGDLSVAAVGLANQMFFILSLVIFGISSGASIYIAQYYGKKDNEQIRTTVAYALMLCMGVSAVITAVSLIAPEFCIGIFTNDTAVIKEGTRYLKIAAWCYPLFALSFPLAVALRSVERPKIPLMFTAGALVINTCLNYLLIFGKFGFPQLGVRGAAVATLTARGVELVLFALYFRLKGKEFIPRVKNFIIDKIYFSRFIKTSLPVILNETMWGLGISTYNAVFGHMAREVVTANQIARNAEQLITALCIGVGSAAAVMIGKKIGESDKEGAMKTAKSFVWLSVTLGVATGILLIILTPLIVGMYSVSDMSAHYASVFMVMYGIFMVMKMYNYTNIVGVLRSGGDTLYCFLLDTCSVWLIGVPFVFLTGITFSAPVVVVAFALNFEELVKAILGYRRYRSGKWVNDLVN